MEYKRMTKKELAVAYSPGLSVGGATNRLRDWMTYNKRLMRELAATDYRKTQHILTARQVEIIIKYLGEP